MLMIGVDYHPSFQQIAFLDQETGEHGSQTKDRSGGRRILCHRAGVRHDMKIRPW
jgi:hypothetical protein